MIENCWLNGDVIQDLHFAASQTEKIVIAARLKYVSFKRFFFHEVLMY